MANKPKKKFTVTLTGTLYGELWQPGMGSMDYSKSYVTTEPNAWEKVWPGLRAALQEATSSGDFQYCHLQYAALEVRGKAYAGRAEITTSWRIRLTKRMKQASDYLTSK